MAGDLVKGPLHRQALHPRVADGVRRHRRVDALTDKDPHHLALRRLFPGSQRRTSGIVLDVLFDHFLHRHWSRFSTWPIDEFVGSVYAVLTEPGAPLPAPLAKVAHRWVDADWLRVYASLEGVAAVLARLESRLSVPMEMQSSLLLLDTHGEELEAGFLKIFANVQAQL